MGPSFAPRLQNSDFKLIRQQPRQTPTSAPSDRRKGTVLPQNILYPSQGHQGERKKQHRLRLYPNINLPRRVLVGTASSHPCRAVRMAMQHQILNSGVSVQDEAGKATL
jgi:hypothetical protein